MYARVDSFFVPVLYVGIIENHPQRQLFVVIYTTTYSIARYYASTVCVRTIMLKSKTMLTPKYVRYLSTYWYWESFVFKISRFVLSAHNIYVSPGKLSCMWF